MAASAQTPHTTDFPAEGRCSYYVEKKKRFCRMVVAVGKRFCGEHAGAAEEENARKRILCPLDPKHTVYEDQLAKHLKKCNSREKPKPDFFIQDINAGLNDETEIPEQLVPISSLSEEQLEKLIKKLQKASEDAEKVHFILVEKVTTRFKVDGKHRKKNSVFERLQIDIQHLCLNKIPLLSKEKLPVVGIGKHLCGVATARREHVKFGVYNFYLRLVISSMHTGISCSLLLLRTSVPSIRKLFKSVASHVEPLKRRHVQHSRRDCGEVIHTQIKED
uniref:tRNA:m(4)X modification enzyme TRM13 n=1 Tax=Suricata suricatta TaxID=37032 RepID=A0A673UTS4_SURSU